jgi:hypothetical protein
MKKRKPPILLATVLLVLLGAFIIINRPPSAPNPNQGPDGQDPETSQPSSRPEDKPGDVGKDIKTAMGNGPSTSMGRTVDPNDPHLMPPGSKVTIPVLKPQKPKPDSGTVTSLRGSK